jgi:hypothetical protein
MNMKARSPRLAVKALEDRSVPSTVAYGDLNHDGLADMAAITNPTTLTVSLANPGGGYTVSAVLTVPANRPMQSVSVVDTDLDGDLDVVASSSANGNLYFHTWLGDGDGTFGNRHTQQWKPPRWFV